MVRAKQHVGTETFSVKIGTTYVGTEILNDTAAKTGSTAMATYTTAEFDLQTDNQDVYLWIQKTAADTNTIDIDYAFILPTYTPRPAFDLDSEVNTGEVKMFVRDAGATTESAWIRVYSATLICRGREHPNRSPGPVPRTDDHVSAGTARRYGGRTGSAAVISEAIRD